MKKFLGVLVSSAMFVAAFVVVQQYIGGGMGSGGSLRGDMMNMPSTPAATAPANLNPSSTYCCVAGACVLYTGGGMTCGATFNNDPTCNNTCGLIPHCCVGTTCVPKIPLVTTCNTAPAPTYSGNDPMCGGISTCNPPPPRPATCPDGYSCTRRNSDPIFGCPAPRNYLLPDPGDADNCTGPTYVCCSNPVLPPACPGTCHSASCPDIGLAPGGATPNSCTSTGSPNCCIPVTPTTCNMSDPAPYTKYCGAPNCSSPDTGVLFTSCDNPSTTASEKCCTPVLQFKLCKKISDNTYTCLNTPACPNSEPKPPALSPPTQLQCPGSYPTYTSCNAAKPSNGGAGC